MLELTERFSPSPLPASRGKGHPYGDLANDARNLADRLECRALACQSASERKRLRVLAAAATQICQCLTSTGIKNV
jgi:hypothetical protein